MKKVIFCLFAAGVLATACNSANKTGTTDKDSSAPSSATDKTAVASDSAKNSSDSLVNAAPDTIKAK